MRTRTWSTRQLLPAIPGTVPNLTHLPDAALFAIVAMRQVHSVKTSRRDSVW